MSKKILALYLVENQLAIAVLEDGKQLTSKRFELDDCNIEEIAKIASGVELIICPGGCLKPISAGTYEITTKVLDDIKSGNYGTTLYNDVVIRSTKLGEILGVPAYFTEAMSVDELLPLNRIRSHADVAKCSRAFRAEHLAALTKALGEKRLEDGNYIVAYIDDIVSVGAYSTGFCLDTNDCIGAEGPMGFKSSGDVPCAQLANYFVKSDKSFEQMEKLMLTQSGLFGYTGIDNPDELDKKCECDIFVSAIADSMIYQLAKWIGSSALVLQGRVDGIILTGKGVKSKYLLDGITCKTNKIAEITVVEDSNMAIWLGKKASLIGSYAQPIKAY